MTPEEAGEAWEGMLKTMIVPLYKPLVIGIARHPEAAERQFDSIDYKAAGRAFGRLAQRHPTLASGLLADALDATAAIIAPLVLPLVVAFVGARGRVRDATVGGVVEKHANVLLPDGDRVALREIERMLREGVPERARIESGVAHVASLVENVGGRMDTLESRLRDLERTRAEGTREPMPQNASAPLLEEIDDEPSGADT